MLAVAATLGALLIPVSSVLAQVSFSAAPDVAVGGEPSDIAVGDFNVDGSQDFLVPKYDLGRLAVRLGNGAGAFSAAADVPVGDQPIGAPVVGDFNGNAVPDFAIANTGSPQRVSVLIGNGVGGFNLRSTYSADTAPQGLALGDFNGDGRQDLALARSTPDGVAAIVSVRLADGNGGFTSAGGVTLGPSPPAVPAVADFNGDNRADLAAPNFTEDTVEIRLGNGAGGFSVGADLVVPDAPGAVAVGDFNGDARRDLAITHSGGQLVSIRLGDGLGGFIAAPAVVSADYDNVVRVADFDRDGRQDLAISNPNLDQVSVRLGNGAGGFSAGVNVQTKDGPAGLAVGDFNADGRPDMAVPNSGTAPAGIVSVLLNTTPTIAPVAYRDVVLGDGPVAYWRLGESSGLAAVDLSGRGNDGVYRNGVGLGAAGALVGDPETGVSLDGVDDHVTVPDSASLDVGDSFTLEAWIKRDNERVHQLFNKGDQGFHLLVTTRSQGNQVWLRKTNVATLARTTGGVPADGRFHHIVATKNGRNDVRIYVDGVAQALQPLYKQAIANNSQPLSLSSASQAGGTIAGDIDEFAVYDNVLTAVQVTEHYQTGTTGP